jgi:ketosteroid isomerase-like protein
VEDGVLRNVREAYARLAAGDPDSFADVLDADVHWRGVARGVIRTRHPS